MPPVKTLPPGPRVGEKTSASEFEALKRRIHTKLVDKLDLTKVGELEGEVLRREIRLVVEHLCDTEETFLNRQERERLIEEVLDETFGLGPLEFLLKDHTMGDAIRSRSRARIAAAFLVYDVAGGQHLPGLTRRRRAERALFLGG